MPPVSQVPTPGLQTSTVPTPQIKKRGGKTAFLIFLLILVLFLSTAVISEILYLARHPQERCELLSCQKVDPIISTLPPPKPVNQQKIERLKYFLNILTDEKDKESEFYGEFKITTTTQGFVSRSIPEIVDVEGHRYVHYLAIEDARTNVLGYRFTQEEIDSMKVMIVDQNGETYNATINDLRVGEGIVLKLTNDLLDSSPSDKITLEISRPNP